MSCDDLTSTEGWNLQLQGQVETLKAGLEAMMLRYLELVNSGDCGNWDPEKEPEVRAARALLKKKTVLGPDDPIPDDDTTDINTAFGREIDILCEAVDRERFLLNGRTALWWHLVGRDPPAHIGEAPWLTDPSRQCGRN